jgi:AcrR family transcriptional regulator
MAPRTEEQFENIRETRKQQILDAALKLFANNGYHSTSIAMIAKEAEISKGLAYNYFESKEELLKKIVFDGIDSLLEIFDPDKDGILTKEELKYFIDKTFEYISKNIEYWRLYFSILIQPEVFKLFENKLWEILEPLMTIMVNYFKKLGIKDPGVEARFFGALMDGLTLNYIMDPHGFPVEAIKKRIVDMYT